MASSAHKPRAKKSRTPGIDGLTPDDLRERMFILETILDYMSEGIVVSERGGRIIYYNRQIERTEGLTREAVLGKCITEIYQVTPETSEHLTVWRTGKPIHDRYQEYMTTSGKSIHLVASTIPIKRDGRILAVFSISRNVSKLRELLQRTVELHGMVSQSLQRGVNGTIYSLESFVGGSPLTRQVIAAARQAAYAACPVLIYGETGSGKEIIAQGIHNASPRKQEPFLALNCAAIPESLLESTLFGTCRGAFTGATDSPGLFEQAGGGTLYLDEINSMNLSLQAKLLRVLEEKTVRRVGGKQPIPVKCSIISSTNVDPWKCVVEGSLRQDLYFRLAGVTLSIPPLRNRTEDIPDLVSHFIKKYNGIYGRHISGLSPEVKDLFHSYAWPGNVRELQHVLEAAVLAAEDATTIDVQHLPPNFRQRFFDAPAAPPRSRTPATSLRQILQQMERQVICETLAKAGNNVSRAAALLGLSRQNLQYKMRRLGISTNGATE